MLLFLDNRVSAPRQPTYKGYCTEPPRLRARAAFVEAGEAHKAAAGSQRPVARRHRRRHGIGVAVGPQTPLGLWDTAKQTTTHPKPFHNSVAPNRVSIHLLHTSTAFTARAAKSESRLHTSRFPREEAS